MSRVFRYALALTTGATFVACATLLDFPDRELDPVDGSVTGGSSGIGANAGQANGGKAGKSGQGGGAGADASPPDAEPDNFSDVVGDNWVDPDASTPGEIVCGTDRCVADGTQACCANATLGVSCAPVSQCQKPNVKIQCDEAADCPLGTICCAELFDGSGLVFATSCRNACVGTNTPVQICGTNLECKTGACLVRTCTSGVQINACTSTTSCL